MPRFRPLSGQYWAAFLRLNQLRIRGIIQRNQCGFSKPLFLSADQTAELKLMKYPRRTLSAAVQLLLRLFHGEVNSDGAVSFKKTVDFWNARPIQHQGIQHFCIVGQPGKTILHQKPWKRYVGCRQALACKLQKLLWHNPPIPSIKTGIDRIDGWLYWAFIYFLLIRVLTVLPSGLRTGMELKRFPTIFFLITRISLRISMSGWR